MFERKNFHYPNIKLYRGIFKIGGRGSEMFPHNPTIINFQEGGKIHLNGIIEIKKKSQ